MNATLRKQKTDAMLSPAKVADYVQRLEARLGRRVECATILPSGGIEVRIAGANAPTNPADLVDMSE